MVGLILNTGWSIFRADNGRWKVWFQYYRKENFYDESLPPGKWTKRESKQNWVSPSQCLLLHTDLTFLSERHTCSLYALVKQRSGPRTWLREGRGTLVLEYPGTKRQRKPTRRNGGQTQSCPGQGRSRCEKCTKKWEDGKPGARPSWAWVVEAVIGVVGLIHTSELRSNNIEEGWLLLSTEYQVTSKDNFKSSLLNILIHQENQKVLKNALKCLRYF